MLNVVVELTHRAQERCGLVSRELEDRVALSIFRVFDHQQCHDDIGQLQTIGEERERFVTRCRM